MAEICTAFDVAQLELGCKTCGLSTFMLATAFRSKEIVQHNFLCVMNFESVPPKPANVDPAKPPASPKAKLKDRFHEVARCQFASFDRHFGPGMELVFLLPVKQ